MAIIHLYVKRHNITGLKYFGKTTRTDPYKYLGSGSYWRRHINKHGKDIETISVWSFDIIEEATKFALQFSTDNNIVESELWANLIPEDAAHGGLKGFKHTPESRTKMSESSKGNQHRVGKYHTAETKIKISNSRIGKHYTEDHKRNISLSKQIYWTEEARIAHGLNQKGRGAGSSNPQYGKIWMTDGLNNVIIKSDLVNDFTSRGYVKGRTSKNTTQQIN